MDKCVVPFSLHRVRQGVQFPPPGASGRIEPAEASSAWKFLGIAQLPIHGRTKKQPKQRRLQQPKVPTLTKLVPLGYERIPNNVKKSLKTHKENVKILKNENAAYR